MDGSRLDDKSGTVFVSEVETNDELELIPEEIVDVESEKDIFVVDGAQLEAELEKIVVFMSETDDDVRIFSGIDAEESSFVGNVSRLDDKSGDVFVSWGRNWQWIGIDSWGESLIVESEKGIVLLLTELNSMLELEKIVWYLC